MSSDYDQREGLHALSKGLPQPRTSTGFKETLDALYEASGQQESRPDFLAKLFAPIPMEAELGAAGLGPQEARFIASQLTRNGYALVKSKGADHE